MLPQRNLMEPNFISAQVGEGNLMLFSPWCYGHYPSYLSHLIKSQKRFSRNLTIVVSSEFLRVHGEVVALSTPDKDGRIRFVAMTGEEQVRLETASGLARAFVQNELITKYAAQLNAAQILIMYADSCQVPLVLGRKLPCPFSGIYFRPTFHYPSITPYRFSIKEQIQAVRERIFLFRLLRHPQLKVLFCLDPFAVEAIEPQPYKSRKFVYLPDPIELEPTSSDLDNWRIRLGIEPNRQVLLSFGRLADERKGVSQLLQAVSLLPAELCQQVCLLFIGESNPEGIKRLESRFVEIRRSLPVQIITQYGHVPEADVNTYFQLADAVLAPYQKHVGMSGILLQAAAAQKPVLSSNYGLMGAMVDRYKLGLAVDTTKPQAIAAGLIQLLQKPMETGDRQKMRVFAHENSAEQFASVIFQHV